MLALIGSAAALPATARAQLEEIVVTAERRETSLQDTPISIVAFTDETLELKGVRDMMDVANIAPNLDIKGSRGTGNTSPNYQIRGIGGGGGATGERGVGFYIDNVFMPARSASSRSSRDRSATGTCASPAATSIAATSPE